MQHDDVDCVSLCAFWGICANLCVCVIAESVEWVLRILYLYKLPNFFLGIRNPVMFLGCCCDIAVRFPSLYVHTPCTPVWILNFKVAAHFDPNSPNAIYSYRAKWFSHWLLLLQTKHTHTHTHKNEQNATRHTIHHRSAILFATFDNSKKNMDFIQIYIHTYMIYVRDRMANVPNKTPCAQLL